MIYDTMILHNRTTAAEIANGSAPKVFVAWDGRESIENHLRHAMVFSALHISPHHRDAVDRLVGDHAASGSGAGEGTIDGGGGASGGMKFVDMFLAMHSDLFLLNPRSTLSWQVYVIRVMLGQVSVPVLRGNDFYCNKVPESLRYDRRPLWVSWTSVIDAVLNR